MKKVAIIIIFGVGINSQALNTDQLAELIGQSATFAVGMGVGHGIGHIMEKMKVLRAEGKPITDLSSEDKQKLQDVIKERLKDMPQNFKDKIEGMNAEEFDSFLTERSSAIKESLAERGLSDVPAYESIVKLSPNLQNSLVDPAATITSEVIAKNYEIMESVRVKYAEGGRAGVKAAVEDLLQKIHEESGVEGPLKAGEIEALQEAGKIPDVFTEEQLEKFNNNPNVEIDSGGGFSGEGAGEMERGMADMMPEFIER